MLTEIPKIFLFYKPVDGQLVELTNDQLRDEVTAWSTSKFSGTALEQFEAARERNRIAKENKTTPDAEFSDYFAQFLAETGVQQKYNGDVDKVFYRSQRTNSAFHRIDDDEQEVPLNYNQLFPMWIKHVRDTLSPTETESMLAALQATYQAQLVWTGAAIDMPVTPEFQSVWDHFVDASRIYEVVDGVIVSAPLPPASMMEPAAEIITELPPPPVPETDPAADPIPDPPTEPTN